MSLNYLLLALAALAGLCALAAFGHAVAARRYWRRRRRFVAAHRSLWSTVFVVLALSGAVTAIALLGYRRLGAETPIATLTTHAVAPQQFAVRIEFPDGDRREVTLRGDQWQIDARVIKWQPRALLLGAPSLYRLDRLSGRYRDPVQETNAPRSVVELSGTPALAMFDAANLKQRFPHWLPWIDADYGSAAYLPLVDGGKYALSLAAGGGLVARPADAATAQKLQSISW